MALTEQDQKRRQAEAEKNRHLRPIADPSAEKREPDQRRPDQRDGDRDARAPEQQKARGLEAVRRHPWIAALVVIVIAGIVAAAVIWWLNARQFESTDDAFIDARTVQISAQVAGMIVDVPVTDNQLVSAGSPLVRIDPRDYQAAVAQAKAQVEQAQASVANLDAQIDAQAAKVDQAQKQVVEAQAALKFSQEEQARYQALSRTGAGTIQRAQQAASDLKQKQAAFAGAQANATAAQKQLAVLRAQRQSAVAQVDQARAALTQATTNLSRTVIAAPVESRVANLRAAKGSYVQSGQALMTLVPRTVWVTANFKETQLSDIRVGQPVDIAVDAYGGRVFHGHVDSIQAGSGSAFSLLPPENATGNYVKVVQRVPVKIVFDKPPDVYLGPGMSVVPSVKVQ
ncbi:MAG TPA: efflux RND transporter periplasmic adaptor subunit [Pseudolabrys sp.]|nr:efflux RND transporter periplasmic adaptor subunit [Pseudolabrys sp.]